MIVATSTLELGIDVGDLDRVIQIGAPRTVASFLQHIGRTGHRPGTSRNCLFLAIDHEQALQAAGLLACWARGWVEPVVAPPAPRHIVAQQLLALTLQEHRIGLRTWTEWWHGISPMARDGREVLDFLVAEGFLDTDGDLAFVGPAAERHFGRRHFMDLMAVFTAAPEFTVLAGREEIGSVGDEVLLADTVGAPRVLLLAGRAWLVTHVDWKRRRVYVEHTDLPGRAKWGGESGGLSSEITRGMRDVLLGADPPRVVLSRRAASVLADLREHHAGHVDAGSTVLRRSADGDVHWWTWAGSAANRMLHASLDIVDRKQRIGDQVLRLRHGVGLRAAAADLRGSRVAELTEPSVDRYALRGLKFSAALPEALAAATVARRLGDRHGAETVLREDRTLTADASTAAGPGP